MKIKMMLAAVMAASMMLTACDSNTGSSSQNSDLQSSVSSQGNSQSGEGIIYQYKDFLDYTFNGNYTISEGSSATSRGGTEYEQIVTTWDINYVGKNGKETKTIYRATNYIPLEQQLYKSQENHDLSEFDSFIVSTMGDIVKTEFVENIASKYMDLQYDEIRGVYICQDIGDLTILCYPPVYVGAVEGELFDKSCEIAQKRVTVGSGYKIADSDLKSICSNDEFTFTCQFVINQGLDKDKYIGIMENMMKDFEEYAGTPANYNFFLAESENPQWLMSSMHLLGNEVTTEQIQSGEVVYADDLKEHIFSKY